VIPQHPPPAAFWYALSTMPSKEWVLDFSELQRIGLQCKACKAETIVDLSGEERVFVPCSCQNFRHSEISTLLSGLQTIRAGFRDQKEYTVRLYVKSPPDPSPVPGS
jgi:hypothetical protein